MPRPGLVAKHRDLESVERQLFDDHVAGKQGSKAWLNVNALDLQRRRLHARLTETNVGAGKRWWEQRDADLADGNRLTERRREASLDARTQVAVLK